MPFLPVADGVTEEENTEEYTEQYCEPEPENEYREQELGFEDGKFNPIIWCIFCPSFYKYNLLACFIKIAYVLPAENMVG